jgi:hypothetical protein
LQIKFENIFSDSGTIRYSRVGMQIEGNISLLEQHLQSKRQVLFTFGAIDELRVQSNNLPCRYTKGTLP